MGSPLSCARRSPSTQSTAIPLCCECRCVANGTRRTSSSARPPAVQSGPAKVMSTGCSWHELVCAGRGVGLCARNTKSVPGKQGLRAVCSHPWVSKISCGRAVELPLRYVLLFNKVKLRSSTLEGFGVHSGLGVLGFHTRRKRRRRVERPAPIQCRHRQEPRHVSRHTSARSLSRYRSNRSRVDTHATPHHRSPRSPSSLEV
jgi:hypothetical protein